MADIDNIPQLLTIDQLAERAAEQSVTQLAFDQAARLLRVAIETLPPNSPKLGSLYPRLGEVLGWAGRNEDAGRAYIAAAERTPAAERNPRPRRGAPRTSCSAVIA